jgi:hypothetical protein
MIRIALADAVDMDPDQSPLVKAGVKLKHPEPYSGGSDLNEFEGFIANILRWLKSFIANILRWLKMNYLLGPTSTDFQVSYLGTSLTGKGQEWFHQNVECFNRQVRNWTLETVIQGPQKRFLHSLTYHHASNKFDAVMQGTKTVQELMKELTKYPARMIQQPDEYTLRRRFLSVLRKTLRNEVLKKGYNAETSSLDAVCNTARMIEEASRYNQGMHRAEAANTAANAYRLAPSKPSTAPGLNRPVAFVEGSTFQRMLPQRPAQAGKTPEVKLSQASGSSAKPNYPPSSRRSCGHRTGHRIDLHASNVDNWATLGLIARSSPGLENGCRKAGQRCRSGNGSSRQPRPLNRGGG